MREQASLTRVEVSNFLGWEQCEVVGNFRLQNYSYLIINLEDNTDSAMLSAAIIAKLEIDGKFLAIIKAENPLQKTKVTVEILTPRELQIANLVALGNCNKQIASHLRISEWTVSTHLRRIFAKLGVDSCAAMVYRCASLFHSCNLTLK